MKLAEVTIERTGMDAEALDGLRTELEPTIRKQVSDTFTAIFK